MIYNVTDSISFDYIRLNQINISTFVTSVLKPVVVVMVRRLRTN
jgi:hypothetical protein